MRRYAAGEFGNASPTWNSYTDWIQRKILKHRNHLFHIRNRIAGGMTWYNVSAFYMKVSWPLACAQVRESDLYISAMAPTEKTVLQGEVQEWLFGLALTYTRVKLPMRDALAKETKHANGLQASILLAAAMDQRSHDWLMYLLEKYRDHVVEFSCYETEWGTIPGYNTVFWEVRKY